MIGQEIYLAENGFPDQMKHEVEPYLRKYREHIFLESFDGTKLSVYIYRLPKTERCIVISHGFCEFAEKYNEMIFYFLKNGYSVYVPEYRGHGDSARLAPNPEMVHVGSYEDYVGDLDAVLSAIPDMEPCRFLFAHSMGGMVAVRYLEEHPEIFTAAVVSSPMLSMKTGKYPKPAARLAAEWGILRGKGSSYAPGQSGFSAVPNFRDSSCISECRYRYIFEKRLHNPAYQTYGGSYQWVRAGLIASRRALRRKNTEKINIPVLLFSAGRDHMVENGAQRKFAARTKHTTYIDIPEAKHEIFNAWYETRVRYYTQIFLFLEEAEQNRRA